MKKLNFQRKIILIIVTLFIMSSIGGASTLRYSKLKLPYEETLFAIDIQLDEFPKTYLGISGNQPPETPEINGPTIGKAGVELTYTVVSTDPEGNDIVYCFDWGDDSGQICIGPFPSGEEITASHTWEENGTYIIKVKAADILGAESGLATLKVKIPRSRTLAYSKIILLGKITSLEKTKEGNFRFLPVKILEITLINGQESTMKLLDEIYSTYPCHGYINKSDFIGIVTQRFIIGVCEIPMSKCVPAPPVNRLVACSANFVSLGGHALRGKFNSQY